MFVQDVNLLPDDLFKRMFDNLAQRRELVPERSHKLLSELFANMRIGGSFGLNTSCISMVTCSTTTRRWRNSGTESGADRTRQG